MVKKIKRWINQYRSSAVILLYHRVASLEHDPQLLSVTPQNFADHLEVLRQQYYPIQLEEVGVRTSTIISKARYVVVTFDDGYVDNLYEAFPLLQAKNVPATIFVTAGQIGQKKEFWWDELERILLHSRDLPQNLEITVKSQKYHWSFDQQNIDASSHWNIISSEQPTARQTAYLELNHLLKGLDESTQQNILRQLQMWANVKYERRSSYSVLDEKELVQLASNEIIEIVAHTITHPTLSAQPPAQQKNEIEHSKEILESILGRQIKTFSYPFGKRKDYTSITTELVKDAGYDYACANYPGKVYSRTDPYQLPRFVVRDIDGDKFAKQLRNWFDN